MSPEEWVKEFPAAITVCDVQGIILDMNEKAESNLQADGGRELVGKNILDCHPEPERSKLAGMLETSIKNVYTMEKNGVKKLIFQSPWFENGSYAGFVEIAFEIPLVIPHFIRS